MAMMWVWLDKVASEHSACVGKKKKKKRTTSCTRVLEMGLQPLTWAP